MSKLFERLLLAAFSSHIKPRDEQYGFRAEHSTTLQVTRLVNEMATCCEKKEYVAAVFLDMEKAFDRVWHEGLLYKLSTSTAPKKIVTVIASFLSNRSVVVSVENALSTPRAVLAGVPQGSCLSPACYAWYTNDIPVAGRAQLALYADDAAYFATGYKPASAAKKVEETLEELPEWLDRWRLSVNVGKTQALISGRSNYPREIRFKGQSIPWSPVITYLGVDIDRRLTFRSQLDKSVRKARTAMSKLWPVLKSKLPMNVRLAVYKTYIRSRLTYAAPAWYSYLAKANKKKLEVVENRCLRMIVHAPRYVRNDVIRKDLRMEHLDLFIRRLSTGMFKKADSARQESLHGIAPLHARPPDEGARRRKAMARDLILSAEVDEE